MGSLPFPLRNNMIYIGTFYSHFGAIRFSKSCSNMGMQAKMMPVPRDLSSSCGTCVRFETEDISCIKEYPQEMEQLVLVSDSGYQVIYRAENS